MPRTSPYIQHKGSLPLVALSKLGTLEYPATQLEITSSFEITSWLCLDILAKESEIEKDEEKSTEIIKKGFRSLRRVDFRQKKHNGTFYPGPTL